MGRITSKLNGIALKCLIVSPRSRLKMTSLLLVPEQSRGTTLKIINAPILSKNPPKVKEAGSQ